MAPSSHKSDKTSSMAEGLVYPSVRKAASSEPLFYKGSLAASDDGSVHGGAECQTASDTLSPDTKHSSRPKKPVSIADTPISTRSSNFMVGSSEDDDVFTDFSTSINDIHKASAFGGRTQLAVYQDSRDKVDPQTMYAGSSCMFVANLPQQFSDRKLEEEVTKVFSQFGIVFVKIKRDGRGMPFAFCQYTNDLDAEKAMTMGKGTVILERPCRTEMARAQSSFIVYKISGQRIRLSEARDLLHRLGDVAKVEYLHEGLRISASLPQTAVVTFKMYDAKRDPPRVFANDPTFCVKIYDPKSLSAPENLTVPKPQEGSFLRQYDRDRRSAYVGNLPPGMTKDLLCSLASSCGEVLEAQLHHKEVLGGHGLKTCFGFLEFSRPDAPDELITAMNNTEIDGYRIRVERKQSRLAEAPHHTTATCGGSPNTRPPASRPRVGSVELEKSLGGRFGTTPMGSIGMTTHRKQYASTSYTPGRNRSSRPTILDSTPSPYYDLFEPPHTAYTASPEGTAMTSADNSYLSPSDKKSVDFDLRHMPGTFTGSSGAAFRDKNHRPSTPMSPVMSATSSEKKKSASVRSELSIIPPPTVPWMASYPPYGYPYMGAPMTPQGNAAMMYAGYMQPHVYHPMFDMYGNMMIPPTPMVPPFAGPNFLNDTPARSERGESVLGDESKQSPSKSEKKVNFNHSTL
ncbi:hypothetical protein CDD81_5073 [Ophiocordyceps australis]|uniref:RRM domain-containing protein n=1 Tax=Ophiocordyceps australis TaxID=1399860 RepID=A0A2C5Y9G5_9HYPO|nr:hypothetical protein CDD81_5073 [Ophiocordyceps australis]